MHELALTQAILDKVVHAARAHGASRIVSIDLSIGAFSDVIPAYVEKCFALASADTMAAGAALRFTRTPGRVLCRTCGAQSDVTLGDVACPVCASPDIKLLSGTAFTVERIQAE